VLMTLQSEYLLAVDTGEEQEFDEMLNKGDWCLKELVKAGDFNELDGLMQKGGAEMEAASEEETSVEQGGEATTSSAAASSSSLPLVVPRGTVAAEERIRRGQASLRGLTQAEKRRKLKDANCIWVTCKELNDVEHYVPIDAKVTLKQVGRMYWEPLRHWSFCARTVRGQVTIFERIIDLRLEPQTEVNLCLEHKDENVVVPEVNKSERGEIETTDNDYFMQGLTNAIENSVNNFDLRKAKHVVMPVVKYAAGQVERPQMLIGEKIKECRRALGMLMCAEVDWPDVQSATSVVSQEAEKSDEVAGWQLHRLAKYLYQFRSFEWQFELKADLMCLVACEDSDWGGGVETGRLTTGGDFVVQGPGGTEAGGERRGFLHVKYLEISSCENPADTLMKVLPKNNLGKCVQLSLGVQRCEIFPAETNAAEAEAELGFALVMYGTIVGGAVVAFVILGWQCVQVAGAWLRGLKSRIEQEAVVTAVRTSSTGSRSSTLSEEEVELMARTRTTSHGLRFTQSTLTSRTVATQSQTTYRRGQNSRFNLTPKGLDGAFDDAGLMLS